MNQESQDAYMAVKKLVDGGTSIREASKQVGITPSKYHYYATRSRKVAVAPSRRKMGRVEPIAIPFGRVSRGNSNLRLSGSPEELAGFLVALSRELGAGRDR